MAIITLADYKTHAGITGTGDDTRLQNVIYEAEAALRRACNRSLSNGFESATRTEDYYSDSGTLQLKEYPVTSITSITQLLDDNTTGNVFESTGYRLDNELGVVTMNGTQNGRIVVDADMDREVLSTWRWEPQFGRVRVVYVSDAPAADVTGAVKRMVDGLYANIRRDFNIGSQSLGGWSVSYTSADEAARHQMKLIYSLRGAGVL